MKKASLFVKMSEIRKKRRKHHKSKRRALRRERRRARRRARAKRPRSEDVTQLLLLQLLQQMQGRPYAKPPVDPYARAGKVTPLAHAHHVSMLEQQRAFAQPPPGPPPEVQP